MSKFEDISRPWKRERQELLTQRLVDYRPPGYVPGTTFVLCGPDPVKATQQYLDKDLVQNYIFAEKDSEVWSTAYDHYARSELPALGCRLYRKDVFDVIKDLCITEDREIDFVSGFDFDFCETLSEHNTHSIWVSLRDLCRAALLKDAFWIRITSSPRGISIAGIEQNIEFIKQALESRTDFTIWDEVYTTYADRGGMYAYQAYFLKKSIQSLTEEEKEKEMKRSGLTLKELSEKDRLMVQILSQNLVKGLELSDVQKKFNLSKMSMAALKAWDTMRNR